MTGIEGEKVRLAHGGGGQLSRELVDSLFLPVFGNVNLNRLNDSAILNIPTDQLAFTTDSFVVDPLFFPGGDIGRLAVCGTVNDLAVMGAVPRYLSVGFILEEGLSLETLQKIVQSMGSTAQEAGVRIVTGDTKVVAKGQADGVFINTSGIGVVEKKGPVTESRVYSGDVIIVSAPLGCHGMSVILAREEMGFKNSILSDVAPLNTLVQVMLEASSEIHAMRDATRGGLAAVLNEMAQQSGRSIEICEQDLPLRQDVETACELLGFDPVYVANEGVLVASVAAAHADRVLSAMHSVPWGREARIAGEVLDSAEGRVVMKTQLGTHRIVHMLSGEQLPRIC